MDESTTSKSEHDPVTSLADNVPIHFQKGNFFRVIHVDGAHGGTTPQGNNIAMSLYSERGPIPLEQKLVVQGEKQKTVTVNRKEGIFREVEVCAVLSLPVAKALHRWLGKQIEVTEKLQEIIKDSGVGEVEEDFEMDEE